MKKNIKATVLSFLVCLLVSFVFACEGYIDNSNYGLSHIKISSAMFENCRVDLTKTKGFGIVKTDNKNFMVKLDENGNLEDVVFLDNSYDKITQEQIAGQIDKLCVTEKFTFIMFVKNTNTNLSQWETPDDNYHLDGYMCDADNQSFAIDNATGKIYSLASLCGNKVVAIWKDYVILHTLNNSSFEGGRPFALKINNGDFVATNLVPNPSISWDDIVTDKFGNTYVAVYAQNERSDNVFYYYYNGGTIWKGIKYCKGNNGFVYKVNVTTPFDIMAGECSIVRMGADFEESALNSDDAFVVNFDFDTTIIVKDNKLFWSYGSDFHYADYNDGKYKQTEREYSNGSSPVFLGEEVFYIGRFAGNYNKLYHYDWITKTETFLLGGVSADNLKLEGKEFLYAYVDSVTGTKKYQIAFANGIPSVTLVSNIVYDRSVITIQPLN